MLKVFQEQIFASFDHLFSFLGGFLEFLPSYPINDFSKSLHQMELIKDNHRFGTIGPDRFDIGIPGINRDCLNRVFLFLTQRIKEGFQGFTFSLLSDKNDLASFPVENNGEIVMSLLDRHFVYCQKTRIFIHLVRKFGFKVFFMNGFHRFPIQVKVLGHFCDGHHRTEKKNILSQPFRHSFSGMNKVQFFNSRTTPWASYRSISCCQSGLGIKTIEIPHRPLVIGMNTFHFLLTMRTHWVIAFIWVDGHSDHLFFLIQGLFDYLDSTKIKEWIKLYLGHRFASSGLVFGDANTVSRKASGVHFYLTFLSSILEKNLKSFVGA